MGVFLDLTDVVWE